ncbi:hypothetical protein ASPZODRAFT_57984 [Penicilliopsis zonata CBS 506.65]|uniref:Beta-xylanase n=1 Tax=Penicilliopsis zonata CBS 506.65 TaxID=1073090 RepID=A0A1L9SS49_9EURO|nr:hypothetical protein ASPZODRAFT_57984 [Penicilliopsis zonata CBS 506.65]OJJ50009.1 hypothetical protein ASPZODRAFT_57984 [Penicilliopsis zonata CBS 506.65]
MALAALVAAANASPVSTTLKARQDISAPYLNSEAQAKGKLWFGTAVDTTSAEVDNSDYMTIFNDTNIFGQTTPGNTMKWMYTEPEQNVFTFAEGEETIALAEATGKKVRCHNLVWSEELPSWVTDGSWTNETLLAAMKTHITREIEYYGEGCYSWDVVNEALDSNGSFTENVFLEHIGEAYVPLAFQYAYEAVESFCGDIKLFYNDYSIEYAGDKHTAAVALVQTIQNWDGAQIDGVGFESHFSTSFAPTQAEIEAAMADFTALGVDVQITELDVPCTSVPCSADALATQAQVYYDVVAACMATDDCTGMTVWDFDDEYSWIQPAEYDGEGDGDLFYSNLTRHPAYTAVSEAIEGSDCSVC